MNEYSDSITDHGTTTVLFERGCLLLKLFLICLQQCMLLKTQLQIHMNNDTH